MRCLRPFELEHYKEDFGSRPPKPAEEKKEKKDEKTATGPAPKKEDETTQQEPQYSSVYKTTIIRFMDNVNSKLVGLLLHLTLLFRSSCCSYPMLSTRNFGMLQPSSHCSRSVPRFNSINESNAIVVGVRVNGQRGAGFHGPRETVAYLVARLLLGQQVACAKGTHVVLCRLFSQPQPVSLLFLLSSLAQVQHGKGSRPTSHTDVALRHSHRHAASVARAGR